MAKLKSRNQLRTKRRLRLRKKVLGEALRPRLSIFRSLKHIHVQCIDDLKGVTVCSASTLSKEFQNNAADLKNYSNKKAAVALSKMLADSLKDKKITAIRFDRSGYKYHGVIKALADGIRDAGIQC